nr:hypothetical protein [uncultured Campylobacter sp.]
MAQILMKRECIKAFGRGSNGYFLNVYHMICYYANMPRLDKNQAKMVALKGLKL